MGSILFSRGSSWPRDQIQASCIVGGFFAIWATREALMFIRGKSQLKRHLYAHILSIFRIDLIVYWLLRTSTVFLTLYRITMELVLFVFWVDSFIIFWTYEVPFKVILWQAFIFFKLLDYTDLLLKSQENVCLASLLEEQPYKEMFQSRGNVFLKKIFIWEIEIQDTEF